MKREQRIYPKQFTDVDVLTAARKRFDAICNRYDDGWVAFSGGKDSLTCLHLMKEARDRAGLRGPVKVMFLDEELLPDSVINFVAEYRLKDWVELYWYVYPWKSNKYILGKVVEYTQWDPGREHVRQPPAWGIFPRPGQNGPFTQYTMNREMATLAKCRGRIVGINGMRADESMNRFCAASHKIVDNWIHNEAADIDTAMPIYDWTENDVMKYLGQEGIRYCPQYDGQLYARQPLRVSTPLHTGSAGHVDQWRKTDPDFFGRVVRVFPEVLLQERYKGELRRREEPSLEALEAWIRENVAPEKLPKAMHTFGWVRNRLASGYLKDEDWPNIWRTFTGGGWLRAGSTSLAPKSRIA
jgi:predicted phosphoadenosine phosphosulfate sulfurtransferase